MLPFTSPSFDVRLRPVRLDDVDPILTWINDPEVTRHFAGLGQPIDRARELAFLQAMIDSANDRLWAVEDVDGRVLGTAGIHKIYWPARNGRVGVMIGGEGARGRGLGQQTLKLLCALGFTELGLHKLWMVHYATNARMSHIADKLGFRTEGLLKEEYFHRVQFHDMVRQAILVDQFHHLAEAWGVPPGAPPG